MAFSILAFEFSWSSSFIVLEVRSTICFASSFAFQSIRASSELSLGTKPYTNCISNAAAVSRWNLIVSEPFFSRCSISCTLCRVMGSRLLSCCRLMPMAVRTAFIQPVGGGAIFRKLLKAAFYHSIVGFVTISWSCL